MLPGALPVEIGQDRRLKGVSVVAGSVWVYNIFCWPHVLLSIEFPLIPPWPRKTGVNDVG
jgi:hypothetical protein